MLGNDGLVLRRAESLKLRHLAVNVGLVLLHVGFAREHARGGLVVAANVNDGQHAARRQQAVRFAEDAFAALLRCLVETVHDGDEIKGLRWQLGVFGVGADKASGGIAGRLRAHGVSALAHGLVRVFHLVRGAVKEGFDHGEVAGEEIGHGNHLGTGVNAQDGFGVGKGVLEGACGDSDAAAEICDACLLLVYHFGEFFRKVLANIDATVRGVVDDFGGKWCDGGVKGTEKSSVTKDVNLLSCESIIRQSISVV